MLAGDIILLTLEMCTGELPLILSLPAEQILSIGPRLIERGAAALSVAAPRGSLQRAVSSPEWVSGRLYGPGLFPQTLEMIHNAVRLGLPLIAAGGVWAEEDVKALLLAGAQAVQIDAALWLTRPPSESGVY